MRITGLWGTLESNGGFRVKFRRARCLVKLQVSAPLGNFVCSHPQVPSPLLRPLSDFGIECQF